MQIVIDISKADYETIKKLYWFASDSLLDRTYIAIKNGITLPEPHGELVDKKQLKKCIPSEEFGALFAVDNAPVIIPATEEPIRTMIDCYKCKNNKADVSCEECHFESATEEEKSCEGCEYKDKLDAKCVFCAKQTETKEKQVEKSCDNCEYMWKKHLEQPCYDCCCSGEMSKWTPRQTTTKEGGGGIK